jgi:hypothetical protein
MLKENNQNPANLYIFLLKSDFHKIDQIIQAKDKTFEIQVCSRSFFFSKEQIILLSIKSFLFILETRQSFNVSAPPNISTELIISCFEKIFSLFSKKSEIVISQKDVFGFQYLSEELENTNIFSICEKVRSSGEIQIFFLTS